MTRRIPASLAFLALTLAGCSHASLPTAPVADAVIPALPSGTAPVIAAGSIVGATPIATGDMLQAPIGLYQLSVDPVTLTALFKPTMYRAVAETDDLYDLSLENLLAPDSLKVLNVTADADSVLVTYSFTHPFAAPTAIDAPATGKNRADLGFAGRVVLLADVDSPIEHTWFDGAAPVILNPALIRNADGFLNPAGLLSLNGYVANTFPYQALVHEANDGNREGIPTGALGKGNYDKDTGWQRDQFGASNTGWTGYGILHQGQSVTNTIEVDLAALQAGARLDLDVAILAKYVDPRGGSTLAEKKANRLPGATPDTAKFVYREPHGALDLETLRYVGASNDLALNNGTSTTELGFTVVDWDARASETLETDLSLEPLANRVAPGTAGIADLDLCLPGILGDASTVVTWDAATTVHNNDTAIGGDSGVDTGWAGDAIYFLNTLNNVVAANQSRGTYTGVVRATDPEDALPIGDRTALTPDLIPFTVNRPRLQT
ncbi:MAG: hypothetical protein ABI743_08610, partial [bacterium]